VRARYGWEARPRSVDVIVVTATLVLPLLAAAVQLPFFLAGAGPDLTQEWRLAWVAVPATLVTAAAFGLLWRREWWGWLALAFGGILLVFYTTLGTHPAGAAGIVWTSLDYWMEQQEVERGTQPWFYYLMMLALYESLVLWAAVAGGAWLVIRRRDWLAALLLFWAGGIFLALTLAGEKMPWLTVHIALPLALLAAYVVGRASSAAAEAVRTGRGSAWRWAGGSMAAVALVLLALLAVRVDWGLNWRHPDTPVEPMIYVQTSPRVPVLAREVRALLEAGHAERVVIHRDQSLTWPWAWYLRNQPILYVDRLHLNRETLRPGDVLLTVRGHLFSGAPVLMYYERPVRFPHRWWFPEDGYRATTVRGLWDGLRDGSLVEEWGRFLWERGDPEQIGWLHAEMFVPKGAPLSDAARAE
jgi:hypothetical protein